MLIERPPGWFRILFPGVLFRIKAEPVNCKRVFLTFDDGPIPEVTPWVLDMLDEHEAKATFFMVGENAARNPDLVNEVVRRGHRVGNHTLHHIRGLWITPGEYLQDIVACTSLPPTDLFRPPHGWLTPAQLRLIKKHFRVVMYDLVTRDYSKKVNSDEVVANVKRLTRDGSIIVFHDSLKSFEKLKTALPESLEWIKEEGYEFELL